jgi:hypothetical protein
VILATTVAGMLQAAWWAAIACALIMALALLAERPGASLSPRGYASLFNDPFASVMAVVNGSAAAAAAFTLGRLAAWLLGG